MEVPLWLLQVLLLLLLQVEIGGRRLRECVHPGPPLLNSSGAAGFGENLQCNMDGGGGG